MSSYEQPYVPQGYTAQQAANAAYYYASQHPGYSPHMTVQEGTVTRHGNTPGYMVKYNTGLGTSTEWTPLDLAALGYSGPNAGAGGVGGGTDPAVAAAGAMSKKIR